MKLLSMTDFVLQQREKHYSRNTDKIEVIENYAQFIKKPLTLGMFVPVDEEGNVLEEPRMIERTIGFDEKDVFWDVDEVEIYRKAKEKVLFEGFEIGKSKVGLKINHYLQNSKKDIMVAFKINGDDWEFNRGLKYVEDLCNYDLELTTSALKQIGL